MGAWVRGGGGGVGGGGWGGGGVRVDGSREVKLVLKFKKKKIFLGGVGVLVVGGGEGVRVDVNGEVKLL